MFRGKTALLGDASALHRDEAGMLVSVPCFDSKGQPVYYSQVPEPKQILEEIQLILGCVSLEDAPNASADYPTVKAKLDELRELKVDEWLLD